MPAGLDGGQGWGESALTGLNAPPIGQYRGNNELLCCCLSSSVDLSPPPPPLTNGVFFIYIYMRSRRNPSGPGLVRASPTWGFLLVLSAPAAPQTEPGQKSLMSSVAQLRVQFKRTRLVPIYRTRWELPSLPSSLDVSSLLNKCSSVDGRQSNTSVLLRAHVTGDSSRGTFRFLGIGIRFPPSRARADASAPREGGREGWKRE